MGKNTIIAINMMPRVRWLLEDPTPSDCRRRLPAATHAKRALVHMLTLVVPVAISSLFAEKHSIRKRRGKPSSQPLTARKRARNLFRGRHFTEESSL